MSNTNIDRLRMVLVQAIESSGFSISGPTDSRAAEHGEPAWVCNARGVLADTANDPLEPNAMTGLMSSLDGGVTWRTSGGVRVMFHDANDTDDGMEDLLVNITTGGVILDLIAQVSGDVRQTATLGINDLLEMTH